MGHAPTPIIDCQCHLFTPDTLDRLRRRTADPCAFREDGTEVVRMGAWRRRIDDSHTEIGRLLEAMETAGVTRTALSPNDPGPEWFGSESLPAAQRSNDFIAETVAAHRDRLFGIGVLPLPDVADAQREMERASGALGLKGFLLYTNLAGRRLDVNELDPLFGRAVELDVPLILHPAKPVWDDPLADLEMIAAVGNMFEDTVALLRLILGGVFDRHPDLKLVCPHLGGALPFLMGRIGHQMTVLGRGPRNLKNPPIEYLRQVWFDIVSPQPSALRLVLDLVGPDRLLFGSDYPWVQPGLVLDTLAQVGLAAADREAILHRNATTLFNLKGVSPLI